MQSPSLFPQTGFIYYLHIILVAEGWSARCRLLQSTIEWLACRYAFTPLAYIRRQIRQKGLKEWQHLWETTSRGQEYCSIARRQPLWGPSWKPTKLQNTDAKTASTTHQLRLGHGYFRAFLARLPNYSSTQCQCSERIQSVKHLLLGCRTYQSEREAAGITRETTLHSLLFTSRGTAML